VPKKSTFTGITSVPSNYFFDVFGGGFNNRISKPNLFAQIEKEIGTPGVVSLNDLSGALQLIEGTNVSIEVNPVDGTFTFSISMDIEALDDVNITSAQDGDGIVFDSGTSTWLNQPVVTSLQSSDNITVDNTDPRSPIPILDNIQVFENFNLSTTNETGIAQGFSASNGSVFTWSDDGVNTSASINHNGIPYVAATVSGVTLADVNFAAFDGTNVSQPVLTDGTQEDIIAALGSTSGLNWVDDSNSPNWVALVGFPEVVDSNNTNAYAPVNPQRIVTYLIDTATDGAQTAHIQPDDWESGDILRFVDYESNFTVASFTVDFESHNFRSLASQTQVHNVNDLFPVYEYIDSTYGFAEVSV
jgi:hypothetical protein